MCPPLSAFISKIFGEPYDEKYINRQITGHAGGTGLFHAGVGGSAERLVLTSLCGGGVAGRNLCGERAGVPDASEDRFLRAGSMHAAAIGKAISVYALGLDGLFPVLRRDGHFVPWTETSGVP